MTKIMTALKTYFKWGKWTVKIFIVKIGTKVKKIGLSPYLIVIYKVTPFTLSSS